MRPRKLLMTRLWPTVRAAFLPVVLVTLFGGCAEKAVEKKPEDIEKSRQEHIKMKEREMGGAPGQQ